MTPGTFIAKWFAGARAHGLGERAGAQSHLIGREEILRRLLALNLARVHVA